MVVAVLPDLLVRVTNVTTLYFGGTGIIIMVGVAIETRETVRSTASYATLRRIY